MRAVKLEAVLPEDRQLNLTVPPEIPSGPVEVVILAKDDMDRRASLLNFLDELVSLPPSARTAAAIEADIAGERQAWDE
jgi:hypothetical protein